MSKTVKGYDVFQNGEFLGFVQGQNKATRQRIARMLVTSTHMGEWIKCPDAIEYRTTIGRCIRFEPCKRLTETMGNYSLKSEVQNEQN